MSNLVSEVPLQLPGFKGRETWVVSCLCGLSLEVSGCLCNVPKQAWSSRRADTIPCPGPPHGHPRPWPHAEQPGLPAPAFSLLGGEYDLPRPVPFLRSILVLLRFAAPRAQDRRLPSLHADVENPLAPKWLPIHGLMAPGEGWPRLKSPILAQRTVGTSWSPSPLPKTKKWKSRHWWGSVQIHQSLEQGQGQP